MTPLLEDGMEVLVDPRAPCRPGDVVLVKGSRAMGLENLVDALVERFGDDAGGEAQA